MLSVNRMLNTEQEHHYDTKPIYSTPSCHSLPPQRSSMLDIANLLCRNDDEEDNHPSRLTTPCLSVTSSPMTSHTKLSSPSYINLSNLDHHEDHTLLLTSPLTPPLRPPSYSADIIDYHYQHRLMFTTDNEDHPSPVKTTTTMDDDDVDDDKNTNNIKTKRRRATNKQLQVLQSVFEHTFFPSTQVRSQLGRQLGMSPRTVQIWFQNRRQALRTKEKRKGLL